MVCEEPKISAIIPTYNRAKYLDQLLKSLLHQTLDQKFYEIIVADNNSNDNTREIVKKYTDLPGNNVKYVFEKNQGIHFSRHAGAKAANSEILAYTDDDSIVDKRWLEELLKVYDDGKIGCAGGKVIIRLDYGEKFRILNSDEYINGANLSIRKKTLYEVDGFNPDQIGEVLVGDGETGLCNKIHKKGIKIAWVPDAVVWHLQIVSKNATLSDMKRRFANNGVCGAYASYRERRFGKFQLAKRSFGLFVYFVGHKLFVLLKKLMKDNGWDFHELRSAYYLSRASYELRLIYNKNLREFVLKEKWLE